MYAVLGIVFCLLLGVMIRAQGLWALLWFPVGFVISLYATAQIVLPLMLGIPRAVRLVATRQMRSGVFIALLVAPATWAVALFLLGFFGPQL